MCYSWHALLRPAGAGRKYGASLPLFPAEPDQRGAYTPLAPS